MHGLLASMLMAGTAAQAATIYTDGDKSFNFGMGISTSTTNGSGDKLSLDDMRIYTSGKIAKGYGFTFNMVRSSSATETDDMRVMDAIAQIEVAPEFNFWAGQFLPAFDRQGLNGPYFSVASGAVYGAGLQADYPAKFYGRDVGAAVWGDVGNFKYQIGAFNGTPKTVAGSSNPEGEKLYSVRLSYALLDAEPGYYTSGTYFGSKNIATIGVYYQTQKNGYGTAAAPSNYTGMGADFLYEKKLDGGGAATLEAGYTKFDLGDNTVAPTSYGTLYYLEPFQGTSWFIQPSWYSGFKLGPGALQPYVKYTKNTPDAGFAAVDYQTDVGVGYIIKGYDTRVFLNYSKPADKTDVTTLRLQMQF